MGLREFRALDADQLSRELVGLGSRNAVARKFGVAPTTVADKMKKLGVSFCQNPNIERFNELSRDEILESLKSLGSRKRFVDYWGVSIPSLNTKMKSFGIAFDGRIETAPLNCRRTESVENLTYDELKRLFLDHGDSYSLAEHLGCSQSSVQRAKVRLGLEHDARTGGMLYIKKCGACDDLMELSVNQKNKRFCSLECKKEFHRRGRYTDCETCGKEFLPDRKAVRFCSRACSGVHMSKLYSDGRLCGENNPNFGNGEKLKKAWERGDYDARPVPKSVVSKGGRFNGTYYRSSWEIAFAEDLFAQGVDGYYEKKRFVLNDGKHYTPDFRLGDTFIEIKGFWYEKSLKKFKVFQEENPTVDVVILGEEWWKTRPSLSEKERCDLNVLRTFHSPV